MEGRTLAIGAHTRLGIDSGAGYLKSADAKTIALLVVVCNGNSTGGNLREVGVHHGRLLFFMLALAR